MEDLQTVRVHMHYKYIIVRGGKDNIHNSNIGMQVNQSDTTWQDIVAKCYHGQLLLTLLVSSKFSTLSMGSH